MNNALLVCTAALLVGVPAIWLAETWIKQLWPDCRFYDCELPFLHRGSHHLVRPMWPSPETAPSNLSDDGDER